MAFLEDPRFRQRWNQITHDAETVTENAAAGIFSFSQKYINPCFHSMADSIEQCTTVCLGDPENRLRRRRERQRARGNAEFSFDFYDDWYEEEQAGGLLGSWGGEDWDRLLAGTGAARKHGGGETTEQPRRKRRMSYGTRGARRKASTAEDPTIIPSTQPIGFLSRLPWKMGGTLRYKPSAADLQDHPGKHGEGETAPLLGGNGDEDDDSDYGQVLRTPRQRSGTTGSGGTSDSYRSRGDLFPSDGEGEEDAVPLDDDVTYDMIKRDDGSSGKTGSSKGKAPAGQSAVSRTVSRSTLGSTASADLPEYERLPYWQPPTLGVAEHPSMEHIHGEEWRTRRQESDDELARRGTAEDKRASERQQHAHTSSVNEVPEMKSDMEVQVDGICPPLNALQREEELQQLSSPQRDRGGQTPMGSEDAESSGKTDYEGLDMTTTSTSTTGPSFHAARLPRFG
ncbi:hypothetical protein C2857_004381 [Epichloe festucae Fl1]|uniref:Uncharacterized protein n=1 Tax=Epichloe festucae (strain Fl1) TaxID=877507 RepID=A0A7S9PTW8_EPIFF|nr:hypothetical protein C2857_004381 [Epichloe festucae Fl1]